MHVQGEGEEEREPPESPDGCTSKRFWRSCCLRQILEDRRGRRKANQTWEQELGPHEGGHRGHVVKGQSWAEEATPS